MKILTRIILANFLAIVLSLSASTAWAADETAPPPNQSAQSSQTADPPGRVARIDYMTGQVSVQPHGTDDWVQAEVNRPLTIADNVWADKESRAELDLGTGLMRINSETSLTLTNVNTDAVQVSLHQGALNVYVRHLYNGEVWEVDTPNMAFTLSKAGDYRFDVDPNADTTMVTVWKGEGEATGQGPAVKIHEGEQVQFNSGTSLAHETHNSPRPDGFDDWCRVRDQRSDRSVSARYVAPGTVGADDLDEYGTWKETPDYGPVWVPTAVSPGWAPYTYGQWAWVAPWGWTWVDAYPWGFAPFHYGRWVSWGGYWGWAPGPYWVRPWYAPALVAWFGGPGWGLGFGWGWGFGIGFHGGFGWCPLGYHDPFFPWYHVSPGYFHGVNFANARIANFDRISNNYFHNGGNTSLYGRNGVAMPQFANKAGAVTAMSRDNLERGAQVRGNSEKVSPEQLKSASALGRVEANPTRQATLGRASDTSARPSSSAFSRATVSRMTPPAASRSTSSNNSSVAHGNETSAHNAGASSSNMNAARTPSTGGRYVPRPPQSLNESASNHVANGGSQGSGNSARNETTQMAMNHNVPRPPTSEMRSNAEPSEKNGSSASTSGSRSVPRPSGPVEHSYASEGRGSYSSRADASYGGYSGRSYGGYSSRSYGGGSYGRSYGSYGSSGSRYGAPSFGSYGGRGSYSSHSSSGSYHGSSGGSHGGGGGAHGGGGHR
jgi:hypothetical protein